MLLNCEHAGGGAPDHTQTPHQSPPPLAPCLGPGHGLPWREAEPRTGALGAGLSVCCLLPLSSPSQAGGEGGLALRVRADSPELLPSRQCFPRTCQGPALHRAIPRRWWVHRQAPAQVGSGPLVWRRASGDSAGQGAEPQRKVPLTPSAGVMVGRQRGPVSSVWELAAITTGHEIGSLGAPGRDHVVGVATGV